VLQDRRAPRVHANAVSFLDVFVRTRISLG
jgi:hypothetical protein